MWHRMGTMNAARLTSIRKRLDLSQELMARMLGVSFASVNRWEMGHSGPTGPIRDLYAALDRALSSGHVPDQIRRASDNERGIFLYNLFRMAYASNGRRVK
jgi:transcriptional regulator with XRE-family HTH domain